MENKKYINYSTFSDVQPYEVISFSKSGKRAKVRRLDGERTNQHEDTVTPGGFCAHFEYGPNGQQWDLKPTDHYSTMSLRKHGRWEKVGCSTCNYMGGRLSDEPVKFYDYNF